MKKPVSQAGYLLRAASGFVVLLVIWALFFPAKPDVPEARKPVKTATPLLSYRGEVITPEEMFGRLPEGEDYQTGYPESGILFVRSSDLLYDGGSRISVLVDGNQTFVLFWESLFNVNKPRIKFAKVDRAFRLATYDQIDQMQVLDFSSDEARLLLTSLQKTARFAANRSQKKKAEIILRNLHPGFTSWIDEAGLQSD